VVLATGPTDKEEAMHSKLSHHLHANNILVTEQYGFRKEYQLKMLPSD